MEEVRSVLHAGLDGACPYGEPPEIMSSDGAPPDAAKGNWLINGEARNVLSPRCGWIVSTPDACAGCKLNPYNRPRPSPRLQFLFYLESLQSAGAVFSYRDLKPEDWRGLLVVKSERALFEREQWKKKL